MSASLTPGPWQASDVVYRRDFGNWRNVTGGPYDGVVAVVAEVLPSPGISADARLIAAAPDLLKALEYIAIQWPDSFAARHARAAIGTARVSTPTV